MKRMHRLQNDGAVLSDHLMHRYTYQLGLTQEPLPMNPHRALMKPGLTGCLP